MNKFINKIIPVILLVLLISCEQEDSTEGVSRITYYNEIELIGDANYVVNVGDAYVEPGAIATENDVDVSENIVITGNVDTSKAGYNVVNYAIKNVDGFEKQITRNVFVLPTDRSTSEIYVGTYTGVVSTGTHPDATTISYLGNGLYYASDFIGGRYNIGFGYGPAYKIPAYFYVTGDGLSYGTLLTSSPWGPWDVFTPTLTGTTFKHSISSGGGTKRSVTLIKQ